MTAKENVENPEAPLDASATASGVKDFTNEADSAGEKIIMANIVS